MPQRYWARVDVATLRWHLETLHDFFQTVVSDDTPATVPVVRWRHLPARGCTEVIIGTWDRLGLLAKIAGAFAQVDLNILRADVYTRRDHVVLDIFQVCANGQRPVADEVCLVRLREILAAALAAHESVLLAQAGMSPLERAVARRAGQADPKVTFDNERSHEYTILEIEAPDRLGLLYQILRLLSDCHVNVAQAIITTTANSAGDVFYLAEDKGGKIRDGQRLADLRQRLHDVLA
jgi:[protein-PII] uridylyltransferase